MFKSVVFFLRSRNITYGLLWLGALLGFDKPILEWGLIPFILGDITKLVLAAAVLPLFWKFVGRTRT